MAWRVRCSANPPTADHSLAGSDTAIILGGTTEPTPDTAFAQAAEDLYLNALGFDGGATDSTVCDMVGTDPCAAPLQVLTTPELIQQGPSNLTAADDVVLAVENEFNADPGAFSAEHPLTIFGYSQSATAESIAMTRLEADGIPTDDLHFVFIGDPSLPDRQVAQPGNQTWTRYSAASADEPLFSPDLGFERRPWQLDAG